MVKIRSADRRARLAEALRENLKRRKARVRAGAALLDVPPVGSVGDADAPQEASERHTPAAKRD